MFTLTVKCTSREIVLQAVCDHEMNFTDIFVGWPGSVHDNRVFKNSDIFERCSQNEHDMFHDGAFLLGEPAYQLQT